MFADDTNLFPSHQNLKTLFSTVNNELTNIHEWFKSNKLSLQLPKLFINNTPIERQPYLHPIYTGHLSDMEA